MHYFENLFLTCTLFRSFHVKKGIKVYQLLLLTRMLVNIGFNNCSTDIGLDAFRDFVIEVDGEEEVAVCNVCFVGQFEWLSSKSGVVKGWFKHRGINRWRDDICTIDLENEWNLPDRWSETNVCMYVILVTMIC